MKRLPITLALIYLLIYSGVLMRHVFWSTGDQTDVVKAGLAAFPVGLLLSLFYPGERTGVFVAVTLAAALNAVLIFYISRWLIRRMSRAVNHSKP